MVGLLVGDEWVLVYYRFSKGVRLLLEIIYSCARFLSARIKATIIKDRVVLIWIQYRTIHILFIPFANIGSHIRVRPSKVKRSGHLVVHCDGVVAHNVLAGVIPQRWVVGMLQHISLSHPAVLDVRMPVKGCAPRGARRQVLNALLLALIAPT